MTAAVSPAAEAPALPGRLYRRYALTLLMAIYVLNFLDRQVVSILAEPIKQDLNLADWQLGMMTGLAFAVLYTVLGLPVARWAERGDRPVIISLAVALWSGFTVLCGLAQTFTHLILARIGVGVGESGCTPPALSLIAETTPERQRASAISVYMLGAPVGSLLGLAVGGLIADAYGWRVAFLVAGVPGIFFALLCWFTLKEPRKVMAQHSAHIQANQATFGETLKYLTTKKTFWLIALGAAIKAFIGYGHAPFTASFFLRVHGEEVAGLASQFNLQSVGFLGLALGLMGGLAGTLSSWLGGQIADRYAKTDLRGYVVVPAFASLIAVPIYITAVSVPSATVALCILVINGLLGSLWYGPVYAIGQSIVPPHMRATTSAILLFIINLIGLGLGPLAVGIISDVMARGFDMGAAQGVRWALIISTCFGVLAFALFWVARKTIREEMES